jgi:hypothetical protein
VPLKGASSRGKSPLSSLGQLLPLYLLVKHYREHRQYHAGYLLSRVVPESSYPHGGLFVEKDLYTYKLPLEYAICSHWVGKFSEALRVYNDMLDRWDLPTEYRDAALRNQKFALDTIYKRVPAPCQKRNRIKVLVLFHNLRQFLEKCVNSLIS